MLEELLYLTSFMVTRIPLWHQTRILIFPENLIILEILSEIFLEIIYQPFQMIICLIESKFNFQQ